MNTLLKIYVMLTMPLSKPAEEALSKPINPKAQGDVRDQQTRRRENAMAQQVLVWGEAVFQISNMCATIRLWVSLQLIVHTV